MIMKLDSKLFDSIRIAPKKGKAKVATAADPRPASGDALCQWDGCTKAGAHRAPVGRNRENEYFLFCEEHVREYNKNYNYFSGLSDDDIAHMQKDALTGHRPTWKVSTNGTMSKAAPEFAKIRSGRAGYYKRVGVAGVAASSSTGGPRRLRPLEKRAMTTLGLAESASPEMVRARYKDLVKQHHPDVNGGNRESEERLQEVLQAYKILKVAGLS